MTSKWKTCVPLFLPHLLLWYTSNMFFVNVGRRSFFRARYLMNEQRSNFKIFYQCIRIVSHCVAAIVRQSPSEFMVYRDGTLYILHIHSNTGIGALLAELKENQITNVYNTIPITIFSSSTKIFDCKLLIHRRRCSDIIAIINGIFSSNIISRDCILLGIVSIHTTILYYEQK